jgi:hypothetical protein
LVYFKANWSALTPFGKFYGHLVLYFFPIWYDASRKFWQPCLSWNEGSKLKLEMEYEKVDLRGEKRKKENFHYFSSLLLSPKYSFCRRRPDFYDLMIYGTWEPLRQKSWFTFIVLVKRFYI